MAHKVDVQQTWRSFGWEPPKHKRVSYPCLSAQGINLQCRMNQGRIVAAEAVIYLMGDRHVCSNN